MKKPLNTAIGRRNWWRLHTEHNHDRRAAPAVVPPADPLPTNGTTVDDGSFDTPVTATTVSGAIKLSGKKASGSSGKMIYSIGVPSAGQRYTLQYDPDFTALAQGGKLAAVGFGFRSGNNFHLAVLKGDGSTGLNAAKISGANFNTTTAPTITSIGAAHNGTQAGPNWLQIETSTDGGTYTLRTSSDGTTWTDEITVAAPSPLSSTTSVTDFGVAAYFDGTDAGSFSIDVKVWKSAAAPFVATTLNPSDKSANLALSNGNLTATRNGAPAGWASVRSIVGKSSGDLYFETTFGSGGTLIGLCNGSFGLDANAGADPNAIGLHSPDGTVYSNGTGVATITAFTVGQTAGIEVDRAANQMRVRNISAGGAWSSWITLPASFSGVPIYAFAACYDLNQTQTVNFGATAFAGAVPTGATGWGN